MSRLSEGAIDDLPPGLDQLERGSSGYDVSPLVGHISV